MIQGIAKVGSMGRILWTPCKWTQWTERGEVKTDVEAQPEIGETIKGDKTAESVEKRVRAQTGHWLSNYQIPPI